VEIEASVSTGRTFRIFETLKRREAFKAQKTRNFPWAKGLLLCVESQLFRSSFFKGFFDPSAMADPHEKGKKGQKIKT